jgi:hypothetical protein
MSPTMRKVIRGGVIGGLILFVWGAFFWKALLGGMAMHPTQAFKDEKDVMNTIVDNAPRSGIYTLPNMHKHHGNKESMKAARDQRRNGPYMFAAVSLEGRGGGRMLTMIKFLIYKIVLAMIVAYFIVKSGKHEFKEKVKFAVWLGFLIALAMTMPYAIIFGFCAKFVTIVIVEVLIGWLFAGMAIAKFAK